MRRYDIPYLIKIKLREPTDGEERLQYCLCEFIKAIYHQDWSLSLSLSLPKC